MTFSLSTTTQGSTLTTTIKAHQLSTHLLAEKPISCDRPRTASHTTNYLSFEVRPPSAPFDDDGPGNLSVEGPRHDNDHVNIRNIQILPTTDEILAVTRAPYMPRKDLREAHFLESPILRLLDTQFRHLRYDNVEYFRDVCYNAAQRLASEALPYLPDFRAQQDTPSGNRYFLYRDAQLEEMLAHERKGLLIRVSYACPAYLRGRGMYRSGRFKEGMLCALIGVDSEDGNLSVTFFETHLAQSTDSMDSRGGNGLRAAVELSFAHSENYSEILRIARYAQGLSIGRFILVEFPNALYAGFYWCLKRLQEMRSTDIAFRSHIAPGPRASQSTSSRYNYRKPPIGTLKLLPPAYVTRDGFTLDLSHLTKTEVRFPPSALQDLSRPLLMDYLKNKTPLDDGQAAAFADSLSRELAFTQGPPGTGKTYLGVALACTILASRDAQDPKPILVVCLTNHALDSFLGGLLEAGQTAIVRVGRGSRESWAKRHSLRSISKKTKFKDLDMKEKWSASQRVRNITNKLSAMANDLNSTKSTAVLHWHDVRSFLEKHHKDIYEQLKTCLESEMAQGFVFDYWSGGGDLQNLANLKKELQSYTQSTKTTLKDQVQGAEDPLDSRLHNIWSHTHLQSESAGDTNIWQLDLTERKRLLDVWSGQIDREFLVHQLTSLHLDVIQANSNYKSVMQRMDKEVLSKQNIIGLTTTACASNWETLKELDLEVVICEEAAEVLESHSLCTLLPSIEHAIFIGDPLQLRPQIEEPNLSLEQRHGFDYRLDESLFERFMIPKDPWLDVIPTSHLSVQRRMHPEISLITRLTYPHLVDHELTLGNPRPIGIAYRTYWLDHTYPEICPSESIKSYSNQYEVHMVVKLVKYLLHGNGYSMGDIAVLTPYNGQLTALNKAMKSTCSIWLCEKDRIALIDDGLLEERDDDSGSKEDVQMSDMLRLATIDNFQGEEAKVVILSTVRSGGTAGFLRTPNRINVACSRARDGFYIIGNATTLHTVPMWRSIIDVFVSQNRIGSCLTIGCLRHNHLCKISHPSDFDLFRACDRACGERLGCGHICQETCHPRLLHEVLRCQQPCSMILDCGHECSKKCFQACGSCTYPIGEKTLDCGHTVRVVCQGTLMPCDAIIESAPLLCGHTRTMKCCDIGDTYECQEKCAVKLPCGHTCSALCADCFGADHPPCSASCDIKLLCGHNCDAECHSRNGKASLCPPCRQPCSTSCAHGRCQNACGLVCDPCCKIHKSPCPHQEKPSTICSLPPDTLPCNEVCSEVLSCGHLCPSLCGEICLEGRCPECENKKFSERCLMLIPDCGHIWEVEALDQHVLSNFATVTSTGQILSFKMDHVPPIPACPCGNPLQNITRYAAIIQLSRARETVDCFLNKIGRRLDVCSRQLHMTEQKLIGSWDTFCHDLRPNPLAARENFRLIGERSTNLLVLQKDVITVRDQVILPFQKSMAKLAPIYPDALPTYNLCFDLRAEVLISRIRSALIEDTLKVAEFIAPLPDPSLELLRMGALLKENALKECTNGTKSLCQMFGQAFDLAAPCLEAELRLQNLKTLHFLGLVLDEDISTYLPLSTEIEHLVILCKRYPSTAGTFLTAVLEYRTFLSKPKQLRPVPPPVIYTFRNTEVNRKWGEHVLGHLTNCRHKHPYSSETFSDGCPECGKEVEFTEEEAKKYGNRLNEDRFLDWMNHIGEQSKSWTCR